MNPNTEEEVDEPDSGQYDGAHPRDKLAWDELTGEYEAMTLHANLAMTGYLFLQMEAEVGGAPVVIEGFVHPDAGLPDLPDDPFEVDVTIREGDGSAKHAQPPGKEDVMARHLHMAFEYDGETVVGGVEQAEAHADDGDDWTRLWAAYWKETGPNEGDLSSEGTDDE
ncbi:MAG: hypothetical protein ACI9CA_002044 [Natronomonas sp.]|jgi:hypothetical protein